MGVENWVLKRSKINLQHPSLENPQREFVEDIIRETRIKDC
jgi:hypothetical protein